LTLSHAFLPVIVAKLSTLKHVRFFGLICSSLALVILDVLGVVYFAFRRAVTFRYIDVVLTRDV